MVRICAFPVFGFDRRFYETALRDVFAINREERTWKNLLLISYSEGISQTSAIWPPRPLPPAPGARSHCRVRVPVLVTAVGSTNSTVSGFVLRRRKGCTSVLPLARMRMGSL